MESFEKYVTHIWGVEVDWRTEHCFKVPRERKKSIFYDVFNVIRNNILSLSQKKQFRKIIFLWEFVYLKRIECWMEEKWRRSFKSQSKAEMRWKIHNNSQKSVFSSEDDEEKHLKMMKMKTKHSRKNREKWRIFSNLTSFHQF